MPLSVTVITKNEAGNIARALESVAWADEILVVDADSSDDTVAIARRFTDRVLVRAWPGYAAQKNFAASEARHDWIFSLDADERVSPRLAAELRALSATTPAGAGYRVPRVAFHLGRWIRSTDWYPDYQLRLYNRQAGEWVGRYVHESVRVHGPTTQLTGELEHYPYRDIAHHLETMNRYTTLAAQQMFDEGRRAGWIELLLAGRLAFLRNYLLRGGFRDGHAGLVVSLMNAQYVGLKFAKLWELARQRPLPPQSSV